jgi:hypothetical protein
MVPVTGDGHKKLKDNESYRRPKPWSEELRVAIG